MTKLPMISVLMTAYNREKYIAEAIESVLRSTITDFELIIVDDHSSDNTWAIAQVYAAKDSRIKVYRNEKNLGDYHNRNKAASYATGKYIKYLDSDDIIYPHGLQVMVSGMEQFPGAGYGLCSFADQERPYPVLVMPKQAYLEHFNGYAHFDRAPGSAIILREAFEKVGGFSGERMIGDTELWFRIARYYPLVKLVAGLYWDRQHEGQERRTDYAKQLYTKLRKDILLRAFAHPDCPLIASEKKMILHKLKRLQQKIFIRRFIKNPFPL